MSKNKLIIELTPKERACFKPCNPGEYCTCLKKKIKGAVENAFKDYDEFIEKRDLNFKNDK